MRNHVDVKLLTKCEDRYDVEVMIVKPNFHSRSVFFKNLLAIEMRKLEVKFDIDKSIYVRVSQLCTLKIGYNRISRLDPFTYRPNCARIQLRTDRITHEFNCAQTRLQKNYKRNKNCLFSSHRNLKIFYQLF